MYKCGNKETKFSPFYFISLTMSLNCNSGVFHSWRALSGIKSRCARTGYTYVVTKGLSPLDSLFGKIKFLIQRKRKGYFSVMVPSSKLYKNLLIELIFLLEHEYVIIFAKWGIFTKILPTLPIKC